MGTKVTVTDMARRFSEFVSRVAFRGERFVLWRGNRPVAELRPVAAGVRLCDLPAVFASLPSLGADEAASLEADIHEARRGLHAAPTRDHWAP